MVKYSRLYGYEKIDEEKNSFTKWNDSQFSIYCITFHLILGVLHVFIRFLAMTYDGVIRCDILLILFQY